MPARSLAMGDDSFLIMRCIYAACRRRGYALLLEYARNARRHGERAARRGLYSHSAYGRSRHAAYR